MTGIVAYGAYVPRLRLQRAAIHRANSWFAPGLKSLANGERAMANWDEDVITMSVEAARDCLRGRNRGDIANLALASTSAPFADRQNSGIVKEALNLPDNIATLDLGGSRKAGTGALLQALRAVAGGAGKSLVVAAERHRARPGSEAELTDGDAAAALLIGTNDVIARFVGAHSVSQDFVDHFRGAASEFEYVWESRWIREEGYLKIAGRALRDALAVFGAPGDTIAHLIVPMPARGVAAEVAKMGGIPAAAVGDTLAATIGHAGTAHPLLMLADALRRAKPKDRILVLGFGQGADVLLLEATEHIAERRKPSGDDWSAGGKAEHNYMKHLAFAGHLDMERGARAELDQKQALTALYRDRKTVLGLVGMRCTTTGRVQFPRSELSIASLDAPVGIQEDYPLADIPAKVLTYTADSLGYTPDPPGFYGMVEFEGGGRMVCDFTDIDPEQVEVGVPMRMMFRIKAIDERRDFVKYFWKAAPAAREK